jgi:chromosome segregation ATPase
MGGCVDDTTELKQKIAELEKSVANQQKELSEFSTKSSAPRDFSADMQRLEDQQESITETIRTKIDPINMKLEEFRDWAQEAQAERGKVAERLKAIEQSMAEMAKQLESDSRGGARLGKDLELEKKKIAANARAIEDLAKGLVQLRKDLAANNERLVEAVKKTLPKVKDAAVAEMQEKLASLEKNLNSVKTGVETERKAIEAIRSQSPTDSGKDVTVLRKRINELEEILASHKSFLLEVGSKLHEFEGTLRGGRAG